MLNLSDKELDRFSKEAAQEYEPGDVLGERAWDRLEIRLDRDLGRIMPNPLGYVRRFPWYYAPAMLVLLGVTFYFIKRSGGPPPSAVKAPAAAAVQTPLSNQDLVHTEKSTLSSSAAATSSTASQAGGGAIASGNASANSGASASSAASTSSGPSATRGSEASGGRSAARANANYGTAATNAASMRNSSRNRKGHGFKGDNALALRNRAGKPASSVTGVAGSGVQERAGDETGTSPGVAGRLGGAARTSPGLAGTSGGGAGTLPSLAGQQSRQSKLGRTRLQGLRPIKKAPFISDSALRAFTLKSTAPQLIRGGGAHVNRSLELGILAAPDFANVNSLAGDRPGSTIGLTADYQFANHWYIGSGLLLDRKIFAARGQDFHAPQSFYMNNGMRNPDDVDLVKGSLEMLEVPLNLRYDFSVTGSTLFFLSSGLSSYLLTSENNNYYYHGPTNPRDECLPITSPNKSYLFSALNLSVGVETGLSNSLSLMIAPYMKLPLRGVGIGQMQMNTVGINFSLRFAPVISRKRY